ncbi:MAG TPA: lysophospholipid acyltransferase family protein [Bacteroidales bacterium]|nr:lysophospholipid acyltransferase family protein [Bacteroidales bacterium]
MKAIGFYIFFGINYLITLLPLRVLYLFSDFFYLVLYYMAGYRRKVVATNLRNAFPEKSEAERIQIERLFYRHLCDLIVETLKVTHMSPGQISQRLIVRDPAGVDRLYMEGKSVIALCSHYNNWEWFSAVPLVIPYRVLSIYKPLTNKYFDRFILNLRTKFGVWASPMQNILRDLIKFRNEKILTISGFIADQTPPPDEHAYWTTFLNQETGFFRGAEKLAVKYDMPVIFVNTTKIKRGYYEVAFELITDHPGKEAPGFVTSRYAEMLEAVIREKPEYWLWSHRRWKYKKPLSK